MYLSYYKSQRFFQKILAMLLVLSISFFTAGCGSDFEGYVDEEIDYGQDTVSKGDTNVHKIGVSMPTKDLQRWIQDGQNIEQSLREKGFTVDLQYANNEINL